MGLWYEDCPKCGKSLIIDTSASGISNCPYCMFFPTAQEISGYEAKHDELIPLPHSFAVWVAAVGKDKRAT